MAICGRRFLDDDLWMAICGRRFVDDDLWTTICGVDFRCVRDDDLRSQTPSDRENFTLHRLPPIEKKQKSLARRPDFSSPSLDENRKHGSCVPQRRLLVPCAGRGDAVAGRTINFWPSFEHHVLGIARKFFRSFQDQINGARESPTESAARPTPTGATRDSSQLVCSKRCLWPPPSPTILAMNSCTTKRSPLRRQVSRRCAFLSTRCSFNEHRVNAHRMDTSRRLTKQSAATPDCGQRTASIDTNMYSQKQSNHRIQ